jgi:hypothetical protein
MRSVPPDVPRRHGHDRAERLQRLHDALIVGGDDDVADVLALRPADDVLHQRPAGIGGDHLS